MTETRAFVARHQGLHAQILFTIQAGNGDQDREFFLHRLTPAALGVNRLAGFDLEINVIAGIPG